MCVYVWRLWRNQVDLSQEEVPDFMKGLKSYNESGWGDIHPTTLPPVPLTRELAFDTDPTAVVGTRELQFEVTDPGAGEAEASRPSSGGSNVSELFQAIETKNEQDEPSPSVVIGGVTLDSQSLKNLQILWRALVSATADHV